MRGKIDLRPVIAALALTVASCGEDDAGPMPAEELLERIGGGSPPFILDVRSPGEYSTLRIPGAVNIPHYELKSRLGELTDSDRELIVYGQTGARAKQAKQSLDDAGFTQVRLLDGHMYDWVMSKYPVE